ncbi:MAG: calcium-binding protein, partial [Phormidium sp.]
ITGSSFSNSIAIGGSGGKSRITTDDGKGLGGAIFALTQETIDAQKKINDQGLPTSPPTVTISSDTTFENNVALDAATKTQAASGLKLNTNAAYGNIKKVQDGPIAGATLFFDGNLNGTQDSDEPTTTTDSAGNFTLDIPDSFDLNSDGFIDAGEGEYVAIGGTDAITGQAFTGRLRSVPGSTVVTPLTTLISTLVDTGALPEASETQVKTALGLPSSVNLATFDPIAAAQAGSSEGKAVLAAQVAVQTLISQISNSLQTVAGISSNSLDAQVTANLAQLLQSGSFNLSDSTAIQTLITNTVSNITNTLAEVDPGNTINLEAITTNVAQLSQVIAASNQQILTATSSDDIFKAQKVAQTSVSQDLVAAFNGTKSFSEVVANNTGVALTNQINAETIDTSAIIQAYADSYLSGDQVLRSINSSYITLILSSNPPHDLMFGDDLANTLTGGIGNDTIFGRSGDDLLNGNQGQDFINGNQGNDTIFAGKDDDLVRGGQGDDLISGDLGNDTLCGDLGNDTVYGGVGDDVVLGNAGDDVLNGNQGNDTLFGGDGNDLLHGGQDHDFLSGGLGNDTVYGDLGNDTLCGYIGNDLLFGGAGNDIFVLGSGQGADAIADFVVGQDLVKLINNLSLAEITISQGTGNQVADTLIRVSATNELLASLSNVSASLITANSFLVG